MRGIVLVFILCLFLQGAVCAAQIPTGQDTGSVVKEYTQEKEQEKVIERLTTPRAEGPALDAIEIKVLPGGADTVFITKIIVQQDPSREEQVKEAEWSGLTEAYNNRDLLLQDIKALASVITRAFSNKGLKAYIPEQSFADGVLYINLVEEQ